MAAFPVAGAKAATPTEAGDARGGQLVGLLEEMFPAEFSKPSRFRKRSFIYNQGDPASAVYCLISGTVALERLDEDGRMAIFGIMQAGTVLAWHDLVDGGFHRNSAEVLAPCTVLAIHAKAFLQALQKDDRLAAALMRQALAQVDAYEEHILRLSTLEVPQRLYSTLCALAGPGPVEDGKIEFSVPLLKRDLAAMIGTSPEGVSRGIRRLEEADMAEFTGRSVRLRVEGTEGGHEGLSRRRRDGR
jgi:CRP-like cAMP-binding protein